MAELPAGITPIEPERQELPEGIAPIGLPEGITPIGQDPGSWRKIQYEFDAMPSDVQNGGIWLESRFPIGELHVGLDGIRWDSPDELWGKGYTNMSPDQRRQHIVEKKREELAQEYPDLIGGEYEEDIASYIGRFGGALATPTTLIPIGKTYKAAAAIGAMIGMSDAALYGMAQNGEINPAHVGLAGMAGFILAPIVKLIGNSLVKGYQKLANRSMDKADDLVTRIDDSIVEARAGGATMQEAMDSAKKANNVKGPELDDAYAMTGRGTYVPTVDEAKLLIAEARSVGTKTYKVGGNSAINDLIEPISARIRKISPELGHRLNQFEYRNHIDVHDYVTKSNVFFDSLDKIKGRDKTILTKALYNQDFNTVKAIIAKHKLPGMGDAFDDIVKMTNKIYDDLHAAGYPVSKLPNYFPRYVTKVDDLLASIGSKQRSFIEKALAKARVTKGELTLAEKSELIDKLLRGHVPVGVGGGRLTKPRVIEEITDEQLGFYSKPREAFHSYVGNAIKNIERKKFFGQHLDARKYDTERLDSSIGAFAAKLVDEGKIGADQLGELQKLLLARFTVGERSSSNWIQNFKNVMYMTTLANPVSALTQLGDIGLAAYLHGFGNTLKSVFGKRYVKAVDLGVVDVAQEMVGTLRTAKVLDRVLRLSGFKAVDRLGKNVALNASLRKYMKMSKTKEGIERLRTKWGSALGEEFTNFVDDLQRKNISDNVKYILFSDLLRLQPVALSEMPLKYLNSPDSRVFYMLKTFTIKQLNLVREDAFAEISKGNVAKGMGNLLRFTAIFSAANIGADILKHWIQGRDIAEEQLEDIAIANIYKNFGASEYLMSDLSQGRVGDAITNLIAPPLSVISQTGEGVIKTLSEGEIDPKMLKHLPIVGKMWYNFFGGGLEKWEEKHG